MTKKRNIHAVRKMRLTSGILYIEHGEDFRVVTTDAMDKRIRLAYRRANQRHNIGRDKLVWLPDGEYYYAHGQMYKRRSIAG